MYAGATKPKPFQRKRANLSFQKQGKLPPLSTMRDIALARHQGSGAPVPTSLSKRVALAFEHVYKGTNSFVVVQVSRSAPLPPITTALLLHPSLPFTLGE